MNKNKKQNKDEYKFTQETRKILCFYQNVIELKKKMKKKIPTKTHRRNSTEN